MHDIDQTRSSQNTFQVARPWECFLLLLCFAEVWLNHDVCFSVCGTPPLPAALSLDLVWRVARLEEAKRCNQGNVPRVYFYVAKMSPHQNIVKHLELEIQQLGRLIYNVKTTTTTLMIESSTDFEVNSSEINKNLIDNSLFATKRVVAIVWRTSEVPSPSGQPMVWSQHWRKTPNRKRVKVSPVSWKGEIYNCRTQLEYSVIQNTQNRRRHSSLVWARYVVFVKSVPPCQCYVVCYIALYWTLYFNGAQLHYSNNVTGVYTISRRNFNENTRNKINLHGALLNTCQCRPWFLRTRNGL